jgi:hypothetical protein
MKNTTMPDVIQRVQTQKTIQELISEILDHTLQHGLPPEAILTLRFTERTPLL